MDSSIEFGRTIGIIRRNVVRKVISPDSFIADFNLKGVLKPNPVRGRQLRSTSGVVTVAVLIYQDYYL